MVVFFFFCGEEGYLGIGIDGRGVVETVEAGSRGGGVCSGHINKVMKFRFIYLLFYIEWICPNRYMIFF